MPRRGSRVEGWSVPNIGPGTTAESAGRFGIEVAMVVRRLLPSASAQRADSRP
jgi:hypothetical protein